MTTVPSTGGGFTNGVPDTSDFNTKLCDSVEFLLNPPLCQVRQTVIQSIPNNVWTALTFTTEDADQANGAASTHHSTSSNTTKITAIYAGQYLVSGVTAYAASAVGIRGTRYAVNGTAIDYSCAQGSASSANLTCLPGPTALVYLNVGDYVELQGYQNTGGALNSSVVTTAQSALTVVWRSN